jgi:hypothetical protein
MSFFDMVIVMKFRQFINTGIGEVIFIVFGQNYFAVLTVDLFK